MEKRRSWAAIVGLVVAAAIIATVMHLWGGTPNGSRDTAVSKAAPPSRTATGLSPDAVVAMKPAVPARLQENARPAGKGASPLLLEFANAPDYRALFQRIEGNAARSAEEAWLLAEILARCQEENRTRDMRAKGQLPPALSAAKFAEGLAEKDPARDKRVAAFVALSRPKCGGIREPRAGEIDALLKDAAARGDAKAQTKVAMNQIHAENQLPDRPKYPDGRQVVDNAKQLDVLRAAFESGDPLAMEAAAAGFTLPAGNISLRMGPDELPVVVSVFSRAVHLLGCEQGMPCGPGSRHLDAACAWEAACDVADLREHYFFNVMSPRNSQLLNQYVEALRPVVRSRDWAQLSFRLGATTPSWATRY